MTVVSDTSAITSLIQIGREQILAELFSRVLIPTAVRNELNRFHRTLPGFLEVIEVQGTAAVNELCLVLDRGEAEAIVLAEEQSPDFVLIDDFMARNVAIAKGLPVVGLLGVLIKAKKADLLESLDAIISDLEIKAGFRISRDLKAIVLKAGGE